MSFTVIIPRRGINDEGRGKKYALHRLIRQADTDYVWLMDDDLIPAPASALTHLPLPSSADMIILPLRMQANHTCIEQLQRAEYAAIQQLTIESAQRGHAVMCSGANLLVRRDRWLESYADIHPELMSGDDMFLLESFKRRGLSIEVLDQPDYTATISALPSLRALLRQRMRWAGKAPHYRDRDILCCGACVLIVNLLQLICPAILLVKFPIEYTYIKKRDASISLPVAFLLELLYPWYMLVSVIGGLFRRQW